MSQLSLSIDGELAKLVLHSGHAPRTSNTRICSCTTLAFSSIHGIVALIHFF